MSKKGNNMVHIQVDDEIREALGILKKRAKAKRLTDVLLDILERHYSRELELAKKKVELQRELDELDSE